VPDAAQFTGNVPERYDRYLVPLLFEPYAADLVGRLPDRADLHVLELAAGTGVVTRRCAEALTGGSTLVATDLNDAMVAHARGAVGAPDVEWSTADAQQLPFEDESFDVVLCQFGFMFLPDKVQGFREARRVLKDGGILLANVWHPREENTVAHVVQQLLDERFPGDPPRFLDTPYGYGDHERLRADLEAAGWENVELEELRVTGESPSAEDAALGYLTGTPLSFELTERGEDPESFGAELTRRLAAAGGDSPYRTELAATVITATR
jgi:SAM-dependent methyltransferase